MVQWLFLRCVDSAMGRFCLMFETGRTSKVIYIRVMALDSEFLNIYSALRYQNANHIYEDICSTDLRTVLIYYLLKNSIRVLS